jgi:CCR4-NOT transcription complex subunit 6
MALGHPNRNQPTSIFTVMCYNVLCDKYATRQLYGYCPNWALAWDYRRKAIMDEIRHYTADIISLQEVETEQFYNFFLPELQREGYDGIFSPKSRAKTMSENERKHVDGCAIFFRTSKFSLIKEHLVEFNQLAMANAEGSDDMLNRVMTKDNIGLAALLQTKEGAFESTMLPDPSQVNQPLLVCTAHIHWDPEYCDVKLIQTMMLMHELRQIVEDSVTSFRPGAQKAEANSVPLILCGDLNSLPDSGVVEFLTSGRISAEHGDFKELGYKDCLRKLSSNESSTKEFTHPFKVAKAYGDEVMPFTNYTFDFKGIIDYVFYSKQHMSVLGLLGPLDPEWLRENKVAGCPHPHVPSDHFPLLVEFEMIPPTLSTSLSHLSNGIMLRR